MSAIRYFQSLSKATQLLLLNEFSLNIGFFMIYPYLAVYLARDLGFPGWIVGLILGIRVFCQQGLTIIGGTLADQIGYKPVIVLGLTLRTVGFGLFGFADTFPLVLLAAILSGLAGAFFGPALRAYLAVEMADRRTELFALAAVFSQAGVVIGPLVGVALLGVSFQLVSFVAAAIFLVLALLQFAVLPNRRQTPVGEAISFAATWREVLANRRFVLFALAMLPYLTLFNQNYLGLPLEVRRLTGQDWGTTLLLVVTSVLTVVAQIPVSSYARRRWRLSQTIGAGLFVMTISFLPVLITSTILGAADAGDLSLGDLMIRVGLVLLSAILLGLGVMLAHPSAQAYIPALGKERITATYFGFYSMFGGISATLGNTVTGYAFDTAAHTSLPGLPWLLLIASGLIATVAMWCFDRQPAKPAIPVVTQPPVPAPAGSEPRR